MKWVSGIAVITLVLTLVTIDPASQIVAFPGPGATLDESFNIDVGWYIVAAEGTYGLAALAPASQMEIFGLESYNPDHPPLGRLMLGLSDAIFRPLVQPDVAPDARWAIVTARPAAAVAFALTVWLVGWVTYRWTGRSPLAGATAALVLATTPRAFGHAHIASLESFVGLTFTLCVLVTATLWTRRRDDDSPAVPTYPAVTLSGFCLGLVFLTKIQAVLIPIPVAIWAAWCFRKRALAPLAIFGGVGYLTFLIGWPYLWLDPVGHTLEFLGRGAERIELRVFFGGEAHGDRAVPLWYTIVMFLVTVPVLWHGLAVVGVRAVLKEQNRVARQRWSLVLGVIAFVLLFFTLPNIAVYDGVRLFLVVYPLWACVAGLGAHALWPVIADWTTQKLPTERRRQVASTAIIGVSFGLMMWHTPTWLSHYNVLVGGTNGATRLGFEASYWGDALTTSFWGDVAAEVPDSATIAVAPVLHQFQLSVLTEQIPVIREKKWRLISYADGVEADAVIAFRRRADLPKSLAEMFDSTPSLESELVAIRTPFAILKIPSNSQSAGITGANSAVTP